MTDPNFNDQDYREAAAPAGGLTREMKLLIGALMIMLMAGGLAFYFNSLRGQNAEEGATVVPVTETTSETTVTTTSTTTVTETASTEQGSTPTTIPPLTTASGATTTAPTELGGINPATQLAAVPSRNPFKPFELSDNGAAPTGAVPEAPAGFDGGSSFAEPSVDVSTPPSYSSSADSTTYNDYSTSTDTWSTSGGNTTTWELGDDDTPVALTGGSTSDTSSTGSNTSNSSFSDNSSSVSTTVWELGDDDTPVALTGNSNSSSSNSSRSPSSTTAAAPASNGTGDMAAWTFENPDDYPEATAPGQSGRPAGSTGTNTSANQPAPPVAGVSEPDLGVNASLPTRRPATASDAATAPSLSVPLPTPGQPSLITEYGGNQGVGAPDDGTRLSRTLNRANMRFTGAVLGPKDTAIFKSNDGFMVLAQGERLPDTEIVVQQITANSVTLALGQESLKLELEPLQ